MDYSIGVGRGAIHGGSDWEGAFEWRVQRASMAKTAQNFVRRGMIQLVTTLVTLRGTECASRDTRTHPAAVPCACKQLDAVSGNNCLVLSPLARVISTSIPNRTFLRERNMCYCCWLLLQLWVSGKRRGLNVCWHLMGVTDHQFYFHTQHSQQGSVNSQENAPAMPVTGGENCTIGKPSWKCELMYRYLSE